VVFARRVLYEWDIHLLWHSHAAAFERTLAAGSWPLWNPWSSFGLPMLADANSQVVYPPTWLHRLVAPPALHGFLVVAHVLFSAVGAFLLFRKLGLSSVAGFTGAACWIASGPFLSLVPVFNMLTAAAWLPWVLLAAERALTDPSPRRGLAWAGALALQLFAGSPDLSLLTGLFCVALVIRHWRLAPGARRLPLLASTGVALVAFVALGAIQWAPSVELARASSRWVQAPTAGSYWSLHPLALLETLSPVALWRLPLTEAWSAALFESRVPFLRSHYLGLPTLVLAAVAFWRGGAPRRLFGAVGLVALLFALGRHTFVRAALLTALPPLALLRFPEKALVLTGSVPRSWRQPASTRCVAEAVPSSSLRASALSWPASWPRACSWARNRGRRSWAAAWTRPSARGWCSR
jgi:hypothetical protein